jgi:hypothetical protein
MMLEILQCLLHFLCPLELVVALEQFEEGSPHSPSREINLFRAAIQLVSFWTSLIIRGTSMAVMVVIFSGFALIPR